MKIKFENIDVENLKKIRELINDIIETDKNEMELTEENLKKAHDIVDKMITLRNILLMRLKSGTIKIVSSDGTELTRMF